MSKRQTIKANRGRLARYSGRRVYGWTSLTPSSPRTGVTRVGR